MSGASLASRVIVRLTRLHDESLEAAARRFKQAQPEAALRALEEVGSWPSSDPALRALQEVGP